MSHDDLTEAGLSVRQSVHSGRHHPPSKFLSIIRLANDRRIDVHSHVPRVMDRLCHTLSGVACGVERTCKILDFEMINLKSLLERLCSAGACKYQYLSFENIRDVFGFFPSICSKVQTNCWFSYGALGPSIFNSHS